jgi:hypothetical protein
MAKCLISFFLNSRAFGILLLLLAITGSGATPSHCSFVLISSFFLEEFVLFVVEP